MSFSEPACAEERIGKTSGTAKTSKRVLRMFTAAPKE
jgi:hypothetical protein